MKKIYLLEDSKIVTELLKFDLETEFNCEVLTFENSYDLIQDIHEKPEMIILDYFIDNRFKENGLEVLKKIKRIDPTIPTIIFSGQHDLKLAVDFIHEGAVDYIDKNEDSFLEDMNTAVKNIFNYSDANKQLSKIDNILKFDKKKLIILSSILITLLVIFFITLKTI